MFLRHILLSNLICFTCAKHGTDISKLREYIEQVRLLSLGAMEHDRKCDLVVVEDKRSLTFDRALTELRKDNTVVSLSTTGLKGTQTAYVSTETSLKCSLQQMRRSASICATIVAAPSSSWEMMTFQALSLSTSEELWECSIVSRLFTFWRQEDKRKEML